AEGSSSSARTTYVVCAAIHPELDLCTRGTAGRARGKMESLAREWRLPSRSLGGAVRGPDELDLPLHQRLRDDAEARKENALAAESGVRSEPLSLGYAMRSTRREWKSLVPIGGFLAVALVVALRSSPSAYLAELREGHELLSRVLVTGFALVGLFLVGIIM